MDYNETNKNTTASNGQADMQNHTNAIFNKHQIMSVTLKRTEKIVTALYMVTDFVSESEPLRNELRTQALGLFSGVRKIATKSLESQYALNDSVITFVAEISSLLTLGSTIGIISEMNGNILISELKKVADEVRRQYGEKRVSVATHPGYANVVLKPEMFAVTDTAFLEQPRDKGQDFHKGQNAITPVLYKKTEPQTPVSKTPIAKKNEIGMKIARRNNILAIIESKGPVSIKDIVALLPQIGEKTIQRELFALVQSGVLNKEGEKRWSLYKIAS